MRSGRPQHTVGIPVFRQSERGARGAIRPVTVLQAFHLRVAPMVLELPIVKHTCNYVCLALVLIASWACSSGNTRSAVDTPQPDPVAAAVQRIRDEPRPVATSGTQSATTGTQTRTEHDLLGEKQIPVNAYYGVQTARALESFQISGISIDHYPGFVEAWAIVKLAAARANADVGAMKPETLAAIEKASQAVLNGKYHDQFLVDWYQGGAGTSTNMNANEVLANVALELSGHKKGEY